MSKSFKASMVGLLLSAATAAAFVSAPAAGAVGGNLECDNSQSMMLLCDLNAQGLGSTLTNINWYYNSVLLSSHNVYMQHGCSSTTATITATYTQSGQNVTEKTVPYCNTGGSW